MRKTIVGMLIAGSSLAVACGGGGAGPGATSPDDAKPVVAAGYELKLGVEDGSCVALYSQGDTDGKLMLAPKPPCFFATENGGIATRTFKDAGELTAVIVAGGASDEGGKQCGMEGQALILRAASVKASERVSKQTKFCEGDAPAEEEFYKFTH